MTRQHHDLVKSRMAHSQKVDSIKWEGDLSALSPFAKSSRVPVRSVKTSPQMISLSSFLSASIAYNIEIRAQGTGSEWQ
jgi:hypothetical protein